MSVFGGQTVGIVAVSDSGDPGYLGIKAVTRVAALVSGCRFRQLSSTETPEGVTNTASEVWKLTAPAQAAALAAKSTGELLYDGTETPELPDDMTDPIVFHIVGPIAPKFNMDGTIHHVTIIAKRQVG